MPRAPALHGDERILTMPCGLNLIAVVGNSGGSLHDQIQGQTHAVKGRRQDAAAFPDWRSMHAVKGRVPDVDVWWSEELLPERRGA